MKEARVGIIGLGHIGRLYAAHLTSGKIEGARLVAAANPSPAKLEPYPGLAHFASGEALMDSGLVDAVIIATPHFQHPALALAALERGLHALIEKPIAAHKADAERLLAAQRRYPGVVLAAMFQLRLEPRYLKIRQLLREGALGRWTRVNWINTDWFRTEAYYAAAGWRATWAGEGGGVLLNQCLHNLDILHWLLGMPARVRGFCQFGKFHDLEVEDDVSAYWEYPGGATGVFVSSTGEAPGTNRLELAGSLGKLTLENERLTLVRNETDALEFSRAARAGFARPGTSTSEIPLENLPEPHLCATRNFFNAILHGEPLIAPAAEGLGSLELANAILYSSLLGQTIELPLDGAAYESKLRELIAGSRPKTRIDPTDQDLADSFRR